MKHIKIILSGLLAGILISLGGLVYSYLRSLGTITVLDTVIGPFLFSLGLFMICACSLHLYTGKIAYVFDNKPSYLLELAEMLLGNTLGCFLLGGITRTLRIFDGMKDSLQAISEARLNDQWYSIFFLAILCGVLVYLGVDLFRSKHHPVIRVTGLLMSVTVFVILGCEHVVADLYYFTAAWAWNGKAIGYIILILVGNSIGSIAFHNMKKFVLSQGDTPANLA